MTAFGSKTVATISAHYSTMQALTTDGTLFGFGDNSNLVLGDYPGFVTKFTQNTNITNYLTAGETISFISQGRYTTYASTTKNRTLCWGGNSYGQCGTGAAVSPLAFPSELVIPNAKIQRVSGQFYTSIVLTDGCTYSNKTSTLSVPTLKCNVPNYLVSWGSNSYGQYGGNHIYCL